MHQALKQYFGYDNFLNAQEEVVQRILAGEELCVVMPTGAGKSVCYQLPVMMRPGYGLIVSPLISLMKDQVDTLNAKGLPACMVNSTMRPAQQAEALHAARGGRIKFLYVAPERFHSPNFKSLIQSCPPNLVVIDEAHCVSQWGHDFRPDYQRIWQTSPELKKLQFAAFTATATPEVRKDIKKQLQRPEMTDIVAGFKRPNLSFQVLKCTGANEKFPLLEQLLQTQVPTIIYTATRKDTDLLAEKYRFVAYHAGMKDSEREQAQDYFMNSPCPVLVATNAFGMGIDRPDIRRVIHFSIPKSLEAYCQEAGRAGRDGQPAECILLFAFKDLRIQQFLIELSNPSSVLLMNIHHAMLAFTNSQGAIPVSTTDIQSIIGGKAAKEIPAALRILERHGIVERPIQSRDGDISLNFRFPLNAPELHPTGPQTQRSVFMDRVSNYLLIRKMSVYRGPLWQLADIAGLSHENTQRVLYALNNRQLHWETLASDEDEYILTEKGRAETLDIDLNELDHKRNLDFQRLYDIKEYASSYKCRQAFIINYFGEKIGNWKCQVCDQCNPKLKRIASTLSKEDQENAEIIIKAVETVDGQFGRKRIAAMLAGEEDTNESLNDNDFNGALSMLDSRHISRLIDYLIENGHLEVIEVRGYPCLQVAQN